MKKLGLIVNKLFVKMSSDSALIEENLDKAKNMLLEKSQKVLMEEIQNTNTTEAINIINSLIQTLNSASTQVNNITTKLETLNTPLNTIETSMGVADSLVTTLDTLITLIKNLPTPTGAPPGIGVPMSIITQLSDILDNSKQTLEKVSDSLDVIPKSVSKIKDILGQLQGSLTGLVTLIQKIIAKLNFILSLLNWLGTPEGVDPTKDFDTGGLSSLIPNQSNINSIFGELLEGLNTLTEEEIEAKLQELIDTGSTTYRGYKIVIVEDEETGGKKLKGSYIWSDYTGPYTTTGEQPNGIRYTLYNTWDPYASEFDYEFDDYSMAPLSLLFNEIKDHIDLTIGLADNNVEEGPIHPQLLDNLTDGFAPSYIIEEATIAQLEKWEENIFRWMPPYMSGGILARFNWNWDEGGRDEMVYVLRLINITHYKYDVSLGVSHEFLYMGSGTGDPGSGTGGETYEEYATTIINIDKSIMFEGSSDNTNVGEIEILLNGETIDTSKTIWTYENSSYQKDIKLEAIFQDKNDLDPNFEFTKWDITIPYYGFTSIISNDDEKSTPIEFTIRPSSSTSNVVDIMANLKQLPVMPTLSITLNSDDSETSVKIFNTTTGILIELKGGELEVEKGDKLIISLFPTYYTHTSTITPQGGNTTTTTDKIYEIIMDSSVSISVESKE